MHHLVAHIFLLEEEILDLRDRSSFHRAVLSTIILHQIPALRLWRRSLTHVPCLSLVLLLPVLLSLDLLNESLASLAFRSDSNLVGPLVENLVNLESLHELAHASEVCEGEEAARFLVE